MLVTSQHFRLLGPVHSLILILFTINLIDFFVLTQGSIVHCHFVDMVLMLTVSCKKMHLL